MTIRATINKYADLSITTLTELKRWLKSAPFAFDVKKFSNPSLQIAQAKNDIGQTLCYCSLENAVIVGGLAFNEKATNIEMQAAGAEIEEAVAHQAAREGATKLLMIVPDNMPSLAGEYFVRVVERNLEPAITQGIASQTTSAARFQS